VTRQEISDDVWSVMEPLMPTVTGRSRPWTDHRLAVRRHGVEVPHRGAVAGRAGAVRDPSRANRAWLRERGIAATIPERDDQIAHRRKKPGRPIDFGDQQQERYKGRNVVERCFNRLKQWRGIAMRSDKLLRSYRAAVSFAATLIWIKSDLINTA
jgi:transposase